MAAPGPSARTLQRTSLIRSVSKLDELLDAHSTELGCDFDGYRGHCYRVLNFCVALSPNLVWAEEKLAMAIAFHDIGIWTHRTFDYLEPSVGVAKEYLAASGRDQWIPEVVLTIREHHKIFGVSVAPESLIESFRRADWIDVSMGLITFGLPRRTIRQAFAAWPSAGFHRKLIHLSWSRFKAYPLSPLPMLKF